MEKIKGFIKDIIKDMFILITFFAIVIVGVYMFLKLNDLHPKGWNEFEQQIQKEYVFIKNIDIHSNERCIFVNYISNKNVDLVEAEEIFKKTKSFLLSDEVFFGIEEYQNKKYHNDFYEIYIRFYDEKENREVLHEFRSSRQGKSNKGYEDFKVWHAHTSGQDNQMSIDP